MGMSASQARLLTLTARIHDVEFQAQSVQNAKIQLATQQDQVYQEYLEALDATTLTYKTSNGYVAANFNNMCDKGNITDNSIMLRNANGALIVPEEIFAGYKEFQKEGYFDSAYQFAIFMIDGQNSKNVRFNNAETEESLNPGIDNLKKAENDAYLRLKGEEGNNLENLRKQIFNLFKEHDKDYDAEDGNDEYNTDDYEWLYAGDQLKDDKELYAKYQELIGKYFASLYSSKYEDETTGEPCTGAAFILETVEKGEVIAEEMNLDDLNYYINYYNKIKSCGGNCVSIEDREFQGAVGDGNPASDSDWLQEMIKSGKITIEEAKTGRKHGVITSLSTSGTSPSSDSNVNYTTTTDIDKRALKKAEAEYENKLKKIDRKDKAYDMTLSKLETQRNALTTEYDSVKKVISDNIERTFGIFS